MSCGYPLAAVRRCAELGDAWHPLPLSLDGVGKSERTTYRLAFRGQNLTLTAPSASGGEGRRRLGDQGVSERSGA